MMYTRLDSYAAFRSGLDDAILSGRSFCLLPRPAWSAPTCGQLEQDRKNQIGVVRFDARKSFRRPVPVAGPGRAGELWRRITKHVLIDHCIASVWGYDDAKLRLSAESLRGTSGEGVPLFVCETKRHKMGSWEPVHVVMGFLGLGLSTIGLGLSVVGSGFKQQTKRLDEISARIESRLSGIEHKFDGHQQSMGDMRLEVERRLAYMESRMHRPIGAARRWYDKESGE